MIEFYPQILLVHILAISLSGALFLLRGTSALMGAKWCYAPILRFSSYLIDTTLLTAGTLLWTILPKEMFANGWIHLKLCLVVVYIICGIMAMRKANQQRTRIIFLVLAIFCYGNIIGIALNHSPLGWLAPMFY